ncbi:lipid A deacylase LpxR family protein [Halorhodospira halochloris]|uniref:lipid A deacylase LpxR family protein n=1 Tax=Halorhodospira halochloris TaxID=1052 RepID=UPI001EE9113C|nr:lipid A deacylase LpxR family protein [Halorhodospira halochloris]MCG5548809.1 lipid A deacylase LpxR family protein [Halorhodospira halochloris]
MINHDGLREKMRSNRSCFSGLFVIRFVLLCAVLITTIASAGLATAGNSSISITHENDMFTGRDHYYTAGSSITWYGQRRRHIGIADQIAAALPAFPSAGNRRLALSIGHKMYTAEDIEEDNPPKDDRPYAGWAYLSSSLIVESGWRQSIADISVGVVGPAAQGHEVQRAVHDQLDTSPEPQGWDHQLRDEAGVVGRYTDRYRARLMFGSGRGVHWGLDVIPGWTLWAGNVYTAAEVELIVRFGAGLPDDYGGPIYHPVTNPESFFRPNRGGWYVYARGVRRLVEHNIFLDGNTVRDSRETEKERYVNQLYAGIAFHGPRMRVSATYSMPEHEFVAQQENDPYWAMQASWAF